MVVQESLQLNDWFEARFEDELARSPMTRTELGVEGRNGNLDDISQLGIDEAAALTEGWLAEMEREFDLARLDGSTALSYRLYKFGAEDDLAMHAISDRTYAFTHMSGPHTGFPSFMVNTHRIETVEDAEDYISRLKAADEFLAGPRLRAEAQAKAGVLLPKFVYDKLITASRNVITGVPFSAGEDSPLFADFKEKTRTLPITEEEREALIEGARDALSTDVQAAYLDLIRTFSNHRDIATEDDGVWKLPDGEAYYQARLKHYTTTDMTADEIHAVGLEEVESIHAEMEAIKDQVGFEGTLQEFFTHLRTDPQFTYSDDAEGRARYIKEADAYIEEMKGQLDTLFVTKPQADVIVKRVEPFRQASAFGAFYERPAADGSRPGTYYINLKDMNELPVYQMQALAYHEGIPGHHMQIAIAQELEGLPKFRNYAIHVPYVEGWALYSESVPAELGLFTDPYQDFGRLSMELFRAVRLVVDTGIHTKQWTREEAVEYFLENSANSEGDIRAEVDRYIVWPGQATAYKIGMLKIEELRARAEARLGGEFDIAEFHDVVLANGSVPLSILEELVMGWVESKEG
jgi:uncharacterized protein (DUF885 family)